MQTKRLFVGLALPDNYQQQLGDLAKHWGVSLASRVTWTKKGNWHLTLKFLGDVALAQVDDVARALKTVTFTSFTIRAGGVGFFPAKGEPRVLWVGLTEGGEAVADLGVKVEMTLDSLGFAPETRPYRPHLTLARIRKSKGDDWGALAKGIGAIAWQPVTMNGFVLWESVLGPKGPSYRRLADIGATSL